MKKLFKNKKNWIFSFILAFAVFLSVAVTIPQKTAKAEISGTIYDYDWANYFDISKVTSVSTGADLSSSTKFSVALTETGFSIHFEEAVSTSQVRFYFSTDGIASSPLPDIVSDENYSFHCRISCNRPEYNQQVINNSSIEFYIKNLSQDFNTTTRYSAYNYSNSMFNQYYGTDFYRLNYYIEVFLPSYSWIDSSTVFYIDNFTFNRGRDCYSYTPYFGSLTELPNPLPSIVESESDYDDSSSDDSSSDESSSSGSSSGSSSSDNSSSDDSSSDFVPSNDYEQGYADGVKFAQYGIFWNCQCYIQLNYEYDYERIPITEDSFIYGGLDLSKFYDLVSDKTGVLSSFIFFNFGDSSSVRPTITELNFYGTGSEFVFISNPWFVTLENTSNSKNLHWNIVPSSTDNNPVFKTEFMDVGVSGSTVVLSFKTPTFSTFDYLDGLTVTMADNSFNAGYIKGENDGYSEGLQAGLNDNQQAIYDEGHRVGYDDGFAKGYAENNSFLGLFTAAIDAPVITFTSMLDFEILGYNMKALVLSLLSAALVVCLIRLFSKGGAT